MKMIKKLLFLPLLFLLTSCFDHADNVRINKYGDIDIVSTIVVTDEEATKSEVKEEIELRAKNLKSEGWNVSYKWKSKSKPYEIEFTAYSTLNMLYLRQMDTQITNTSGIWITNKFSQEQYVVTFERIKDANNRIVKLTYDSVSLYRPDGEDGLEEFREINDELQYYVLLGK